MLCLIAAAHLLTPADLVIENAQIWSDGLPHFAQFAAVKDGQFTHVGEKRAELIGPATVRVDAGGKVVIPGLIDSHVHMLGGGMGLTQLQLRNAGSKEEFIERIKQWTDRLAPGKWVLGGRWSAESWPGRPQPTKDWVDPLTGDRPLYLSRMDGHSALANSAALKIAGITKDGPADPPGGVIDRDPVTKEPTGILRETAMGLVSRHIPATTREDRAEGLRRAMREANRHGITAVSDICGLSDLALYEELGKDATIRFSLYPTAENWSSASARAKAFKETPGWIKVGGFKAYFDGTLGSKTALMKEPFLGSDPDKRLPMPIVESGQFLKNARAASSAGLQSIVHAIGDQANHLLLEQLVQAYPNLRDARCRSEHAQHLLPSDILRFGQLGVIASMQPYHKADDGRYAEDYIGHERSKSSYAFKSLLDAGAVLAFGSDWPVVSINPFLGIEAAVTGKTMDGKPWQIQENITVAEALRSYTSRGAYAMFMEDRIGKIAPGFRADFVILNQSPFSGSVDWKTIRPVAVYVDGRRVHGE